MEELINEQINVETHPAEADKKITGEEKTGISLGKFKDVNALLNAYNSLESEFTKRCQRIKELEGIVAADKENTPTASESVESADKNGENSNPDREEIVKDYLIDVLKSKQGAKLISGAGTGVKAPAKKPRTISEAGMLAKEILQN